MRPLFKLPDHRSLPLFILILLAFMPYNATALQVEQQQAFNEYKGKVVDNRTGDPVASAFLSIDGTNISTVTNSEGEFSLKVPVETQQTTVSVSAISYDLQKLALDYFKKNNTIIEIRESAEELSEVTVFTATDPRKLVKDVLEKRGENYFNEQTEMTAFYREAIRRGRRNVSLSEAVLTVHKSPYSSGTSDQVALIKARKSADYEKLDTLALKLRGGPFNTLHIDLMKNPQLMFNHEELDNFNFSFGEPAVINNKYLYVVNFDEMNREEPWYYGKLYIDAESLTLVKASFNLNVDNRRSASRLFVKRKPNGTKVRPVNVTYDIDYREQDGKWYYGYGRAELEFVVNWRRKLFNSRYTVNSEMAITDWKINPDGKVKKDKSFLNDRVVMADDVAGFGDVNFWGDKNIIEPDKSIQNAIEKIQEQIREQLEKR